MIVTEKAPAKINLALDTPMRYLDGLPRWNMVITSPLRSTADRRRLRFTPTAVFCPMTNET